MRGPATSLPERHRRSKGTGDVSFADLESFSIEALAGRPTPSAAGRLRLEECESTEDIKLGDSVHLSDDSTTDESDKPASFFGEEVFLAPAHGRGLSFQPPKGNLHSLAAVAAATIKRAPRKLPEEPSLRLPPEEPEPWEGLGPVLEEDSPEGSEVLALPTLHSLSPVQSPPLAPSPLPVPSSWSPQQGITLADVVVAATPPPLAPAASLAALTPTPQVQPGTGSSVDAVTPGAAATAAAKAAAAAIRAAAASTEGSVHAVPETVKALGEAAWALVDAVPTGPMQDAALAVAHAALAVADAARGQQNQQQQQQQEVANPDNDKSLHIEEEALVAAAAAKLEEQVLSGPGCRLDEVQSRLLTTPSTAAPLEIDELGEAATPSFTADPPKPPTTAGAVPPLPLSLEALPSPPETPLASESCIVEAPSTESLVLVPAPQASARGKSTGGLQRSSSAADCHSVRSSGQQRRGRVSAVGTGRDSWALGVDSNEHYRRICSIGSCERHPLNMHRVSGEGSRASSGPRTTRVSSYGTLPRAGVRWAAPDESKLWSRTRPSAPVEPSQASRPLWQSPVPPPQYTGRNSSPPPPTSSRGPRQQPLPAWGVGRDRPGAILQPSAPSLQPRNGVVRLSSAPGTCSDSVRDGRATVACSGGRDGSASRSCSAARSSSLPRSPRWEGPQQGAGPPCSHEAFSGRGLYKPAADRQVADGCLRRGGSPFGHQLAEARTGRDPFRAAERCRGDTLAASSERVSFLEVRGGSPEPRGPGPYRR